VMDGTPADSPFASTFPRIAQTLPHEVKMVEYRAVGDVVNDLTAEMTRRQGADDPTAPSIYLFVFGLQRYRTLRKGEDDAFSFSMSSDEEKKPNPGKQFADLLREGPPHGIHVVAFADTPATVERTFERNTLREFDTRILFQMSANDSSNLIDSPAANKLGFNRALAFSEEQGTLEKFRPYALPPKEWLEQYRERLAAKASPARAG
jgi:DNA segregation ATPase FtsK/SpoIIIE, S-DNA-T family